MGERVVAYARDSGGRDQQLSVDQQLERIGAWCREHDYVLARVFADRARSGTTLAGRDEFRAMMSYLDTTPESGVVLWEYSRLARDYDSAMFFVADLRRRGIAVYSMSDNIPDNLDGRLLEAVTAWKNARYSEDLARNVSRGLRYLVAHHKGHAGRPPKGYAGESIQVGTHRDGSPHMITRLIPDPDTAPLVRQAFEMRAAGATLGEIHDQTHLFDWLVVYSKMLANPIYTGTYRFGGQDYPDFCEPIVDQATWQQVQQVNQERRERHGYNHPRAVRSRFYLTGLLFCARCGRPMHGKTTRQRAPWQHMVYDYYRCSSTNGTICRAVMIPKNELETVVLQAVSSQVLTDEVMGAMQAEVEKQAGQVSVCAQTSRQRLDREQTKIKSRIGRIVAAIAAVGHSQALIDELEQLEHRQAEIIAELARVERPVARVERIDYDLVRAALVGASDVVKGQIMRGFIREAKVEKIGGVITGEITAWIGEVNKTVGL